jgi:hypothetical protein
VERLIGVLGSLLRPARFIITVKHVEKIELKLIQIEERMQKERIPKNSGKKN